MSLTSLSLHHQNLRLITTNQRLINNPSISMFRFEDARQVLDETLQPNSLSFHIIFYKISGYLS
ncbi:hypothetical protein HanRHA438_Chr02g0059851 [Helianthus annuus]|uniref:Uncharacterized protein n=1 Tax=Helianthus annuus TaxID=4232 RepID=A0A9K3JMQ0_HELAN|nr:hypothetical protein HanXRQr2_Chr02g0057901 [Helianthus annuus]KAJ0604284.1 hypothetical protein HanHA300_Chr02g0047961 [Helianthus annuus]KAJ0618292.1 hypothetical protein HanHA89_Chr02g0051511 [Helianthus annuus]KAJ0776754.1 hypothetical protein HanLR1_Chr02g0049271 [Helianthus annuus]KAJ0801485.1 hypothetical protein HanPI659440_Chr03g0117771 [Helianthus annuus]